MKALARGGCAAFEQSVGLVVGTPSSNLSARTSTYNQKQAGNEWMEEPEQWRAIGYLFAVRGEPRNARDSLRLPNHSPALEDYFQQCHAPPGKT